MREEETHVLDKAAPMPSAPMRYLPDGSVDWGNMWDSFCVLAQEGGPPHRGTPLRAQEDADTTSDGYRFAVAEIIRGIDAVSDLAASAGPAGWIVIRCNSPAMAQWLSEAIIQENVQARANGTRLLVPAGEAFTIKGEIKNVITAVAKTTHYWREHLPVDVKRTVALQTRLSQWGRRVKGWFTGRAAVP